MYPRTRPTLGLEVSCSLSAQFEEKRGSKKKNIQISPVQEQNLQKVVPLRRGEHDEDVTVGNSDDQCLITDEIS